VSFFHFRFLWLQVNNHIVADFILIESLNALNKKLLIREINSFVRIHEMKVEESDSAAREKASGLPEKTESGWNQYTVSTFQRIREKELIRLSNERPSKSIDPQSYFNYRAREEQIKYELDLRQFFLDFLSGSLVESSIHYGHALNHLKRRGEYEKKLYAVWLERVRAQENPPTPDIVFINQGIRTNQLV